MSKKRDPSGKFIKESSEKESNQKDDESNNIKYLFPIAKLIIGIIIAVLASPWLRIIKRSEIFPKIINAITTFYEENFGCLCKNTQEEIFGKKSKK